jgi:hypothetical protein
MQGGAQVRLPTVLPGDCKAEFTGGGLQKPPALRLCELELPSHKAGKGTQGNDAISLEDERSESSKSTAASESGRDPAGKDEQAERPEAEDDDDDDGEESPCSKGVMKRAWAPEEDSRLLELVEEFGPRRWSVIAQQLQGRVGKQCRERCAETVPRTRVPHAPPPLL